jgi:hypothetical protein
LEKDMHACMGRKISHFHSFIHECEHGYERSGFLFNSMDGLTNLLKVGEWVVDLFGHGQYFGLTFFYLSLSLVILNLDPQ